MQIPIHQARRGGFTLIEMSIVLVIIGMLVGGIFVGKSMIRQARIDSVMTDATRYSNAAQNFLQKYGALPGDMSNATSYWGALASPTNTSSCYTHAGSVGSTATCDGDGNGQIGGYSAGACTGYESTLFFEHLSNAQMIEGGYVQSTTPTCWTLTPGTDAPLLKLTGSVLVVSYIGILSASDGTTYLGTYGHAFDLTSINFGSAGVLTPLEAQAFDTKWDDGTPANGNIRAQYNAVNSVSCTSATGVVTDTYNLASTYVACNLWFLTGF